MKKIEDVNAGTMIKMTVYYYEQMLFYKEQAEEKDKKIKSLESGIKDLIEDLKDSHMLSEYIIAIIKRLERLK